MYEGSARASAIGFVFEEQADVIIGGSILAVHLLWYKPVTERSF
jgi:hypothetical protein